MEELERDMAAALGSFDRMVTAGARRLMHNAEEAAKNFLGRSDQKKNK